MTTTQTVTFGLVEDSEEDFVAFSRVVAREAPGTNLRRWSRGEATLESLHGGATEEDWPAILVVDLNLPGIDGCELVRRLREHRATRALPVFVLSGSGRQADIDRCYAAGANGYLTKPGSSAELRTLLQTLLRSLSLFRAPSPIDPGALAEAAPAASAEALAKAAVVDPAALAGEIAAYESELLAERDAERRGRQRAEALQRIAVRLSGLTEVSAIHSALAGELVGSQAVDRANVAAVLPGSAPVSAFFSPQFMSGGMTGELPIVAPSGTALGKLTVESADDFTAEQQQFLAEAAELAGQALDRVARTQAAVRQRTRATTDLPVRKWWQAAIEPELRRIRGSGHPFTVVAVEIDDFERIATQQGAVAADQVLLSVLDGWRQVGHDLLSTHGGEEYSAILPGITHRQARQLIAQVRQLPDTFQGFSTGIAQWDQHEDAGQLVARAEAALAEERRLRGLS